MLAMQAGFGLEWYRFLGVPDRCVQFAHRLLMLYEDTYERGYFETAFLLNGFARRTLILNNIEDVRGGVKGSFPIYGDHGKFELVYWACRHLIDSNTLEFSIRNWEFDSG